MRGGALIVVAVLAGLTGCVAPPPTAEVAPRGVLAQHGPKKLVAAIRGDPRTLSEALNSGLGGSVGGTRELDQLLNAGLSLIDSAGQPHPQLATVVPTLENGLWKLFPDGRMETTWNLRPQAVWHDGAPFTAADLLFTARLAQDRELPLVRPPAYAAVDSLDAPDPHSLIVTWKRPFIDADTLFTHRIGTTVTPLPHHLLEGPYAGDKDTFLAHPYWTDGFIGAGPYKLRSWTVGSNLVLEANESYVLGRPKVHLIEVRFLLDTNVIVANLLSGEVQLTLGRGLTVEQAILARNQWRQGTVDLPLVQYTAIWPQFLNPDPVVMLDLRFRRAMYHALDRQQIIDTFLGGLVPVANTIINPDMPEFSTVEPLAAQYPYDPRTAARLLEEIPSIQREADGFYYERATGKKVSLETETRTHGLRETLQPVLGDMWGRVGVGHDPLVTPELLATGPDGPKLRSEFRSFRFLFNPVDINRFHGSLTPLPETRFRGSNYSRYQSVELDALIDRYNVTIPLQERYDVLAQAIRHMTESVTLLPLFHDSEPVMINQRVLNAKGRRGIGLQTWNAHEWDIKS